MASRRESPEYEATEDLFIYNPESGCAPVAAYRTGDRVVADVVAAHGWEAKVRVPPAFAPPEAATAARKE